MDSAVESIEEVVHRETRAWNTKDLDLLLSVFHPDMVWPWPPHEDAHDPLEWVIPWGRYNEKRWRAGWGELFKTHELVHNRRVIQRIEVDEGARRPTKRYLTSLGDPRRLIRQERTWHCLTA